jgi:hypothetical protein
LGAIDRLKAAACQCGGGGCGEQKEAAAIHSLLAGKEPVSAAFRRWLKRRKPMLDLFHSGKRFK